MENWPALPYEAWKDTCETLHMWTQIVGKVRMELSPPVNHWWHVTLYVTPRGLTTSAIPYQRGTFAVNFDFIEHNLFVLTSDGTSKTLPLIPRSVAAFYREFMACLQALGIEVTINTLPSEIRNPIRCDEDEVHASYDPVYAHRFWRVLAQADTIMQRYRSPFLGKPGDETFEAPAFYSYTLPEPPGLKTAALRPSAAWYSPDRGLFLLRYEDVRSADAPEQVLLEFLQSTYEAGATLAQWDRETLEREAPSPDGTHSQS